MTTQEVTTETILVNNHSVIQEIRRESNEISLITSFCFK